MKQIKLIIQVEYAITDRSNIKDNIKGIIRIIQEKPYKRVIKTYEVESREDIDKTIEEAKDFCDVYTASMG